MHLCSNRLAHEYYHSNSYWSSCWASSGPSTSACAYLLFMSAACGSLSLMPRQLVSNSSSRTPTRAPALRMPRLCLVPPSCIRRCLLRGLAAGLQFELRGSNLSSRSPLGSPRPRISVVYPSLTPSRLSSRAVVPLASRIAFEGSRVPEQHLYITGLPSDFIHTYSCARV